MRLTVQLTSVLSDIPVSKYIPTRYISDLGCVECREPDAMSSALSPAKVASAQQQCDFSIKPETVQPVLSTSEWPLLLKNYDKLLVRSSHFTPIPSGCSPLRRDITSYIKLTCLILFSRLPLSEHGWPAGLV